MTYLLCSNTLPSDHQAVVLEQLNLSRQARVLFISSQTKGIDADPFINQAQADWQWVSDVSWEVVGIDDPAALADLEGTFDIVILSGGNTFYFMYHARDVLDDIFDRHVSDDALVIGLSAGAILMTPSVATAGLSHGDENMIGLEDMSGLDLVNFQIVVHFDESDQLSQEVSDYSEYQDCPVYALPEDGGLVIDNDRMIVLGEVLRFKSGQYERV